MRIEQKIRMPMRSQASCKWGRSKNCSEKKPVKPGMQPLESISQKKCLLCSDSPVPQEVFLRIRIHLHSLFPFVVRLKVLNSLHTSRSLSSIYLYLSTCQVVPAVPCFLPLGASPVAFASPSVGGVFQFISAINKEFLVFFPLVSFFIISHRRTFTSTILLLHSGAQVCWWWFSDPRG